MSSTPHDASSSGPMPASHPTVDDEEQEVDEQAEADELERQLDLVARKSPI